MADELARLRLMHLPPGKCAPADVLEVVDKYLYEEQVRLELTPPPPPPPTDGPLPSHFMFLSHEAAPSQHRLWS